MSWGYKITVLYVGFILLIISMVALTMREKVDLVSKDYYEQELKYQDKIDKVNRTNALKRSLTWKIKTDSLILEVAEQFKAEKINGSIFLFRPSDAALDKTIPVEMNSSGMQVISTDQLKKGIYKMQVSWEAKGEEYYNEGIIQVN